MAVLLGNASYALYLTHVFVMIAYGWLIKSTFLGSMSQIVFVPVVVSICVIVGALTHIFVEKPVLEFVRKVTRHRVVRPALETSSLPRDRRSAAQFWQNRGLDKVGEVVGILFSLVPRLIL